MNPTSRKILIVDDDIHIIALVKAIFTGFSDFRSEVIGATSVDEAIGFLMQFSFDLVISDYQMPERDGLELVLWIRDNQPLLPIMLTSGFADISAASLYDAGVVAFFSKPFESKSLLRKVKKNLAPMDLKWGAYEGPRLKRIDFYCNSEAEEAHCDLADLIGRGGILASVKRQQVMRGDMVNFYLRRCPGDEAIMLDGIGSIAWVESTMIDDEVLSSNTMQCGIEFESLSGESLSVVQSLLANHLPAAFIPLKSAKCSMGGKLLSAEEFSALGRPVR